MTTFRAVAIWKVVESYIPAKHHNERRRLLQDLDALLNRAEMEAVKYTIETHQALPLWRRVYLAFLNRF